MKRHVSLLRVLAMATAGVWVSCSSGTDVAGGSGAGNPGGQATLAFLAQLEGTGAQKQLYQPAPPDPDTGNPYRDIDVVDRGGTQFRFTSLKIPVDTVVFLFDPSATTSPAIDDYAGTLAVDSSGAMLVGGYVFDAITGEIEPSLRSVLLPEGRYAAVRLHIAPRAETGAEPTEGLVLRGLFTYDSVPRTFRFVQSLDTTPEFRAPAGQGLTVSEGDTAHFTIMLLADDWLSGIDYASCIESGGLPLDVAGNLDITVDASGEPCMEAAATVGPAIIQSGQMAP